MTLWCDGFDLNEKPAFNTAAAEVLIKYENNHIVASSGIALSSYAIINAWKNPFIDMGPLDQVSAPSIDPESLAPLGDVFSDGKSHNDNLPTKWESVKSKAALDVSVSDLRISHWPKHLQLLCSEEVFDKSPDLYSYAASRSNERTTDSSETCSLCNLLFRVTFLSPSENVERVL